ncbi:MAG: DEAD/DEAH box helicase family protein [Cetobacterium sp.]
MNASNIYKIEKYLEEQQDIFRSCLLNNKRSLIVAPCGTGKTFTTINALKQDGRKFIFAVPNVAVKEQLQEQYNLTGTTDNSLNFLLEQDTKEIVCCYESLQPKFLKNTISKLKDYTLIYDEYHSLIQDYHYRDNTPVLSTIKEFGNVKFLTATPFNLINSFTDERIDFITTKTIKANVEVIMLEDPVNKKQSRMTKTKKRVLVDTILKKKPFPTLYVSTSGISELEAIFSQAVINSKNRKGGKYESIIKGILPQGLTLSTNLFNAGLSLNNKEEVNLIIDFKGYDISKSNFTQLINRFRCSKLVNVFVIQRGIRDTLAQDWIIEEWLNGILERINNGESSINEEKVFSSDFFNCIGYDNLTGKFYSLKDYLPLLDHKFNGNKNKSDLILKEVCKVNNWSFKTTKYEDLEAQEFEKISKEKDTSKNILKQYFIDKNNKIKDFAYRFIKTKILKDENNIFYLNQDYGTEASELNLLISQNKKMEDIFYKTIKSKISKEDYHNDITKVLNNYFKIVSDYEKLKLPKDLKSKLKEEILKIGSDTKYFTVSRKILNENIPQFPVNRNMNPDSKVKSFLEFLGIKSPKKEDKILYVDKKKSK